MGRKPQPQQKDWQKKGWSKPGRKLGQKSGTKSQINPQREEFTEIRAKLWHGYRDWKMMRLRRMVEASRKEQLSEHKLMLQREREAEVEKWKAMPSKDRERCKRQQHDARVSGYDEALNQADQAFWNLPDNYLSARTAEIDRLAANARYTLFDDELDALWRDVRAQFERAVLDGDATWFERQAKAIGSDDIRSETDKARDQFDAAVARELEMGFWKARAEANAKEEKRAKEEKHKPNIESATLTPAGKRAGVTAQQVLDALRPETVTRPDRIKGAKRESLVQSKRTYLVVAGCRFESKRRAREAITRIAELYGWKLAD